MDKNKNRICQRCGKHFVVDKSKGNAGVYCSSCRTTLRRQKIIQKAIEYLGGKCMKCGYNKNIAALEFHHKNPTEKDFTISRNSASKKWDIIQLELDKCDLLCSNCHREEHAKNDIPLEVYQKYITPLEKLKEKAEEKNKIKEERKNILLKKYKNLNIDQIYATKIYQRKVKRPKTYEQFKKEMDELNWNYCAMGRKYGVTDNAIRKWEKIYQKYGI